MSEKPRDWTGFSTAPQIKFILSSHSHLHVLIELGDHYGTIVEFRTPPP